MRVTNLLFCFAILLLVSCSQNTKTSPSQIINETVIYPTNTPSLTDEAGSPEIDADQNNSISEELQALGLPLKGKNVFNPTKIKVGDIVQGFVLTEIEYWEGRFDYPFDTVSAKFIGEGLLTGELEFIKKDEFYPNDWLSFRPDAASQEILPISHHESRGRIITLLNQDEAVTATAIKPGQTRNVTLKIQDYTLNFLPTDEENTTLFLEIYEE